MLKLNARVFSKGVVVDIVVSMTADATSRWLLVHYCGCARGTHWALFPMLPSGADGLLQIPTEYIKAIYCLPPSQSSSLPGPCPILLPHPV